MMPHIRGILTYKLALILLLSINYSLWVTLIFPSRVLVVSVVILIRNYHRSHPLSDSEETKI